jgi:alpha-tubulin suppressor-like RCC1 family protein
MPAFNRGDAAGEMGDNLLAVGLGNGRTATSIRAGALHTCALLDDSSLKCWGRNDSGQLGLGDTNHRGDVAGEMGDNLPVVDVF